MILRHYRFLSEAFKQRLHDLWSLGWDGVQCEMGKIVKSISPSDFTKIDQTTVIAGQLIDMSKVVIAVG